MKISQFYNVISYENRNIIFNTLNFRFLIIDQLLLDLIEAATKEDNIKGIEDYHPTFYNALVDNGFLVTKETDEVKKVKDIRKSIDFDNSIYHLVINPTMNCNFKCWYCYESHVKDSKMDLKTIKNINKHLYSIANNNKELKSLTISWFGGEPLLYFDKVIVPILEETKKLANKMNLTYRSDFTTNGYLITPLMIQKFKNYNIRDFQITLDGNKELHDTVRFVSKSRGSFDEIVNNIKLLCQAKLNVTMRINYTKTNLIGLEKILDSIVDMSAQDKEYLYVSFHKVWQETDKNLEVRVIELMNIFEENGFKSTGNFVPDTLRASCYADKSNQATVNYNGEVFKCTARDFTTDKKEGVLNEDGEIMWNGKYQERLDSKFKNPPCLKCSILPLCNGGCSQVAIENAGKEYCVYDFDEKVKNEIVLKKFMEFTN